MTFNSTDKFEKLIKFDQFWQKILVSSDLANNVKVIET